MIVQNLISQCHVSERMEKAISPDLGDCYNNFNQQIYIDNMSVVLYTGLIYVHAKRGLQVNMLYNLCSLQTDSVSGL